MLIFQEKCELGCLRAIVLFNPDARGLDPNVSAQVTKQTLFCNNLQWGSVLSDMVNVYECYFEVGLVLSKKRVVYLCIIFVSMHSIFALPG